MQPVTGPAYQHLLSTVLLYLTKVHDHRPTVLLHDPNSCELAGEILLNVSATPSLNATSNWILMHWPDTLQRTDEAAGQLSIFDNTPLVLIAVRQPTHEVIELLDDAFDWRNMNNQSQHVVFVETNDSDVYNTQRFVDQNAAAGRLLTIVEWWQDELEARTFQPTRFGVTQQHTLDYYMMFDPPHSFHAVDVLAPPEVEMAANETRPLQNVTRIHAVPGALPGYGGQEVWLVEMIAMLLNRSINYFVYDYRSFQPEDCFDCDFFDKHYRFPYRVRNVPSVSAIGIAVTASNFRILRKASHNRGPVIYTGLSYFVMDELDVVSSTLYPYNYENYRIVVPTEELRDKNDGVTPFTVGLWDNQNQSQMLMAWCSLVVLLVAVRMVIARFVEQITMDGVRSEQLSLSDAWIQVMGVALATSSAPRPQRKAEVLWLATLALFALMVGILCAGVLFQRLTVKVERTRIETLQQLIEDGRYSLMVPYSESLPPGLSESFHRKNLEIYLANVPFIMKMIWTKKSNFAYIIPESKLGLFNAPHLWENQRCLYRVLDEIFCECYVAGWPDSGGSILWFSIFPSDGRYASLKISPWFLRNRVDRIIQRARDHGQLLHFDRWSSMVSDVGRVQEKVRTHNADALQNMHYVGYQDLWFVLEAYAFGNGLAFVVFVVEIGRKFVRVSVLRTSTLA